MALCVNFSILHLSEIIPLAVCYLVESEASLYITTLIDLELGMMITNAVGRNIDSIDTLYSDQKIRRSIFKCLFLTFLHTSFI